MDRQTGMLFYGYCSFTPATADCNQSGGRSELKEIQTEVEGYCEGTMLTFTHDILFTFWKQQNRSKQNMLKHANSIIALRVIIMESHGSQSLSITQGI